MTETELMINDQIVKAYRQNHPSSRVTGMLKLIKNTASIKQYGCVVCGAEGPTFAAQWRETKKSIVWSDSHVMSHINEEMNR